jgi:DNA-binding NarL/FixJ family response regulator
MMRTLIVAGDGRVLAELTSVLREIPTVDIAAYANGRARIDRIIEALHPDVVIVEEMRRPALAVTRIADAHAADPACVIIGLTEGADASWAADGLRAGASAVVPRDLSANVMQQVLVEAIAAGRPAIAQPNDLQAA